jgi:D-amino peptidase
MRVYISVDMEGVAGVSTVGHISRGSDDYPYYRRLMTEEASAAVAGAVDAGATEVLVNDGHGDMANLVPDLLHRGARLLHGSPKPGGMTAGLDGSFDACLFIGYHARAGELAAVRDHTINGAAVHSIIVNGREWSESDLNALHAGSVGVPLVLVSGDDKICAHVREHQPWARTVEVKRALGNAAAASVHPDVARELIRSGVAETLRAADGWRLFQPDPPFELSLRFHLSAAADAASRMPGAERVDGRTIRFTAADVETLLRGLGTLISLGGTQSLRR